MDNSIPVNNMNTLIDLSRKYGADPDYVLAGGGNTSWKSNDLMVVKASGTELGTITKEGFVTLSMDKLRTIRETTYPDNREEREERALEDLMNSRLPDQKGRPSVESLLHAIIPDKYVVHTHPAIVNGLTCSQEGKEKAEKLVLQKRLKALSNKKFEVKKIDVEKFRRQYEQKHKIQGRPWEQRKQ